jgi:hypothetical protein
VLFSYKTDFFSKKYADICERFRNSSVCSDVNPKGEKAMKKTFIIVITLTLGLVSANAQETADEYEQQITAAYVRNDMKTLDEQLASYYKSGLYPLDVLMYNYNEMQGMEDWGVMVMSSAESLIGKLMLQRVLNVHRDKVLVCTELGGLDSPTCERLDIPMPATKWQDEKVYEQSIKWVADHADRAVYFPFTDAPLFMQFPDSLKECIYNEGLTMRYSATPYDNIAVKIRNLEERYLTDYLRLSLQPYNEKKDQRLYRRFTPSMLALSYSAIYLDMLPYYREHKPDKVEWLEGLYSACQTHYNHLTLNKFYNTGQ